MVAAVFLLFSSSFFLLDLLLKSPEQVSTRGSDDTNYPRDSLFVFLRVNSVIAISRLSKREIKESEHL